MILPVSKSITRPNDTTPYTAGDVIGTAASQVLVFDLSSTPFMQSKGAVYSAMVISSAAPTTLPSLELWLFSAAPTAIADNEANPITDAQLLNLVGIYPLSASYVGLIGGNHVQIADVRAWPFELASGVSALYGVLVVRNAYTPIANEVYKVVLGLMA